MKSAVLWPTSLSCLLQASKPPVIPAAALPLGDPESLKGEGAKKQEIKPPSSSTTWAPYIKGWNQPGRKNLPAQRCQVQRFNPHVDAGSRETEGDRWLQGRTCGCNSYVHMHGNRPKAERLCLSGWSCGTLTVGESVLLDVFCTKPTTQLCVCVCVRSERNPH